MSEQSINLFNNLRQKQPNFTAQNPSMQGGNDAIAQATQASGAGYVNNRLNASKDADPLTTLGLTTAIGYGIGQGMDYFGPKCEGKYEQTILGKLGAFGDKIAKTKVGAFIERQLDKVSSKWNELSGKSRIVYTLRNHSTQPEWQFAKMPWAGLSGFWSTDAKNIIEKDLEPISAKPTKLAMLIPWKKTNDFNRLLDYGMSKEELKTFEDSLKGMSFEDKAMALQKKQLQLFKFKDADMAGKSLEQLRAMAKEHIITKRYCTNVKDFERITGDILKYKDEFMNMLENATKKGDVRISINKFDNSWWGKIKAHFAGREVTLKEYYNKGIAAMGKKGASRLGRALPKALGWLVEGCTNRFAGGKLAPFMQAFIFADMAYHTVKAPKGEHGKTLIERFVNDFSYFAAMTLGLMGIHKIGGGKYIGTDNTGREAYRAALEIHKAKNKAGKFLTKKAFNDSLKAVDAHLNVKDLKWYQKIWQKAARFINLGNEYGGTWNNPNAKVMNVVRKMFNKNLIGVPLRIWLAMSVITPVIVKAATKTVHAIFGRPTHSVLDEEEEETNEAQVQNETAQNQPPSTNPNELPDTNLIKQTINAQNVNDANNSSNQNNQQQPALAQNNNGRLQEPVRTYIPSPVSMVNQGLDPSRAEMAMARADMAEQQIADIMASVRKS